MAYNLHRAPGNHLASSLLSGHLVSNVFRVKSPENNLITFFQRYGTLTYRFTGPWFARNAYWTEEPFTRNDVDITALLEQAQDAAELSEWSNYNSYSGENYSPKLYINDYEENTEYRDNEKRYLHRVDLSLMQIGWRIPIYYGSMASQYAERARDVGKTIAYDFTLNGFYGLHGQHLTFSFAAFTSDSLYGSGHWPVAVASQQKSVGFSSGDTISVSFSGLTPAVYLYLTYTPVASSYDDSFMYVIDQGIGDDGRWPSSPNTSSIRFD